MNYFISCDWGTSNFRLRLIDTATEKVLAEILSQQGIAATYNVWKEQQNTERFSFYSNYILTQVARLEEAFGNSLNDVPLVISGMASSAIGIKDLPYKKIPIALQPQHLPVHIEAATATFPHKLILVSGVRSSNDVMRGEETKLIGCIMNQNQKQLFILPGTHSKHIIIEDETLVDFKTYMTGELFSLLSTKSILSNSVEAHDEHTEKNDSFIKGLLDASASSLLNNIFHVRTNALFNIMNTTGNYAYLSGLLIGSELKEVSSASLKHTTLVSGDTLRPLYLSALNSLGVTGNIEIQDADEALIKGQVLIANKFHHFGQG